MIRTCIAKATAVAALVLGVTVLFTPATVAAAPSTTVTATADLAAGPRTESQDTGTWGG